jgi:quercetin dioxygenase-like cupin family protein
MTERKSPTAGILLVAVATTAGCAANAPSHPHDHPPRIVPAGTAPVVDFPGHRMSWLVRTGDTASSLTIFDFEVAPRSFGAPPHIHKDEDEYFYVIEGELSVLNGEEVVVAPAGSMATLTRGHLHAFWNASDRTTRVLLTIAPGKFGDFFDEVVVRLREEKAADPEAVGAIMTKLAAERNVEMHPEKTPEGAREFLP